MRTNSTFIFLFCIGFYLFFPLIVWADSKNIQTSFSGQIKLSFSGTNYKKDSINGEYKKSTWFDSDLNLRIISRTFFNDNLSFECHYVMGAFKGDTIKAQNYFLKKYPHLLTSPIFQKNIDDNTQVFDLSSEIKKGNNYFVFQRLDRLNLSMEGNGGRIIIGRQAVTWGNGFIFNPMDILNPFLPGDIDRDYKRGDDMISIEAFLKNGDDLQFIYVPRRDSRDGKFKFSKSSLGAKYHFGIDDAEFDLFLAEHYQSTLTGIGCIVNIGDTVVRSDIIYGFAHDKKENDSLSAILNIDYSWVWFEKNFYGFIEYYHSRKNYLSSGMKMEITPLINLNLTSILNLNDSSCLIQPCMTWNITQNHELTLGGNIAIGGKDDEYGQTRIPFSQKFIDHGSNLFLWLTIFF